MECSTRTTLALRRHTIGLHVVCVTDNESADTNASWTSVLKHCTCKNPSRKCRSSGCLEMTRIRQDICHARKVVRKTCYIQAGRTAHCYMQDALWYVAWYIKFKNIMVQGERHSAQIVCVCEPALGAYGFPVTRDMSSPRHVHSRQNELSFRSGHLEALAESSMTTTDDAYDGHAPKPSANIVCTDVGKCATRHEPQRQSTLETTMPYKHMHDL